MTLVRNGSGVALLCCWDDCEKPGHEEIKVVTREGTKAKPKDTHYVFCSAAHKSLFKNSHHSYGNAAPGERSPLGLILPLGINPR
jgi:YHS domain-containing protein